MTTLARTPTAEDYRLVFEAERERTYPVIDAFEQEMGYAIDREKLEAAARVLACPVKANPPNWCHGRVLYSVIRNWLAARDAQDSYNVLDIGTAKGFSALCMLWAFADASATHTFVASVDVLDPHGTDRRNTVAEIDGPVTLKDILAPWPESACIAFSKSTGIDWLEAQPHRRIHIAFVDGKHTGHVVRREGVLLSQRQKSGDMAIFDDVHIGDVSQAVVSLNHEYKLRFIDVIPGKRSYAIGRRR